MVCRRSCKSLVFAFGHRLVLPHGARLQRQPVCSGVCLPPGPPPAPPRVSGSPPRSVCYATSVGPPRGLRLSFWEALCPTCSLVHPPRLSWRVPSFTKPLRVSPLLSAPQQNESVFRVFRTPYAPLVQSTYHVMFCCIAM